MLQWIAQARQHWKEHQPQMYARLLAAGTLQAALERAAEQTLEQMQTLQAQGFPHQEAWEQVRELYLFPPEEESDEKEELPAAAGYAAMLDYNRTMASLGMPEDGADSET